MCVLLAHVAQGTISGVIVRTCVARGPQRFDAARSLYHSGEDVSERRYVIRIDNDGGKMSEYPDWSEIERAQDDYPMYGLLVQCISELSKAPGFTALTHEEIYERVIRLRQLTVAGRGERRNDIMAS